MPVWLWLPRMRQRHGLLLSPGIAISRRNATPPPALEGAFSVVNFLCEDIVNRLGGRTFYTFYVCAGSALASKHEQLRHVIIPPVAQKQQNGL